MNGWDNFLVAEVSASAALMGLVFVGISINLTKILSIPRLPDRALLTLVVLLVILVLTSLLLVPGQPLRLIGVEVLAIGLISWTVTTLLDVQVMRETDPRYRGSYLFNICLSQAAMLPYVVAGITLLTLGASGLYWLAPAIIFSFIKAGADAWVLLIEINR